MKARAAVPQLANRERAWHASKESGVIFGLLVVAPLGHTAAHEPKAPFVFKATWAVRWARRFSPNAGA
jgi:hypothetical protein